jgi:hypothetical protein
MGHSFLQWSGTLGGHLVTEEGDLGCFEDALRRSWLGSRASVADRKEFVDVALALRETGRKRGCHPSKRSRSLVPARCRPWIVEMFVRGFLGRRTWKETRISQMKWWWRSSECRWDGQESGYMLEQHRSWRRSGNLRVGDSSYGCDRQDSGLESYERWALYNLRRDADAWCEVRRPRTLGAASCAISQHGVKFRLGNSEYVRC